MSAPPGPQRSLGASLLDQVLADTLDPAYAQAAAARAARIAARAGAPVAPRPWHRRHRGRLLVALTFALAGLLGAVTYREAAVGAQGREQVREALRADITREQGVNDELTAQQQDLIGQVTRTREDALTRSVVGQRALERLAAAEQGAAVLPVSGPGLRITLGNAPPATDSDPVGGSDQLAEAGIVQDGDLQLAVNALWAAGAEAISIDGQRVGASTAIRQAGEAILVDFRPVASPYEVLAVGEPDDLARHFLASPEVNTLAEYSRDYGVVFDFARSDDLDLPTGTAAELRFAQPLDTADAGTSTPTTPTDGG